ncbi:hypothetical protein ABLE92_13530 [Gordonia sp. VNQ95]|uniref:hypothetical protein n=1 Tax=Gordonia sp. VNQ95 TaxID=3156619 RepID=UPI0032B34BCC
MSDFINKIKEDAKAIGAAIDNELTVLEGVPGYDPLADESSDEGDEATTDAAASDAAASDTPSDDTEGGGSPA